MKKSYDAPFPFTDISERYDELMDAPIRTKNGDYVSSMMLADRGFQHEWFGRQLNRQPARFGFHFREDAPVVDYLGADANTNGHMYELPYHGAILLRAHPEIDLSDEERGILMFAFMGHDMDETTHEEIRHICGGVTGDIKCGEKTDEDKILQAKIRRIRDIHLYPDIPQSTLDRVESIIAHNDDTILGFLYEAAHELQSLDTTHVAEETLLQGRYDPADQADIERIATEVRHDVLARLAPLTGKFAFIGSRIQAYDETAA